MITLTREIEARLDRLRPGQLVSVRGFLVDASRPERLRVEYPRSRSDIGDGSCEVVWVEALETD